MSPKQKEQLDEEIAVASAMADEAIADEQIQTEKKDKGLTSDEVSNKTMTNTDQSGCRVNVPDVEIFGEDLFKLLAKASSESEGWMKSTKAMDVGKGCIVQVTTQQRNPDGSYSVAEAVTYVPGVTVVEQYAPTTDDYDGTSEKLVGRRLKGVR